jgi:Cdc6-like AAA superfamily ATPase
VVILGIANALDLSIRYFSAPPSRVNILNFSPYTPEDISRILIARLELTPTLIVPVAVEMCARKVSAVGDLRKALEIMRESVTLAETSGAERVELAHVTQAMERIFGSTVRTTSRNAQLVSELNLHQKLLLVTLYRLLKDSVTLKPTVQSLFERYTSTVRTHRIIDAVGRSEFNDLVANTESMGVISLVAAGKRARNSGPATPDTKVLLSLPLEDVKQGLSDNTILRQMLIL